MYQLDKCILVTNNDKVYLKYRDEVKCILLDNYEDVLIKVRDSSLKPNQTPYRSIIVYPKKNEDNTNDILLIEKCLEVFRAWQNISATPQNYENRVSEDFKTIDLSVIENIIPRIF